MASKVRFDPTPAFDSVDTIRSAFGRLVWGKLLIATVIGAISTWAFDHFERLPHAVILGILWVTSAVLVFFVLTFTIWIWDKGESKLKQWSVNNPLEKRVKDLEAKVNPRTLLPDQRVKLMDSMKAMPGRVRIVCIWGDEEAANYAQEYYELFKQSGWTIFGVDRMFPDEIGLSSQVGLNLFSNSPEGSLFSGTPIAQNLANALAEVGIHGLKFYGNSLMSLEHCEIRIGHRA